MAKKVIHNIIYYFGLFLRSFNDTYFYCCSQISLVEMPKHGKKKIMSLTTNVMRDDSDKVVSSECFLVSWFVC